MPQPEAEGRKATRLRCGDERAACTRQSEPARGCARHSAAPVSLISQPHLPETPGGPPEKKKKKKEKSEICRLTRLSLRPWERSGCVCGSLPSPPNWIVRARRRFHTDLDDMIKKVVQFSL